MRKGFAPLLCALCIGLCACTAAQQSPGEEGSFPDSAELSATAAPEQEGSELPYDLYRDCRPAEDVFHLEKIELPQNPEGQVFSPVAFLDENTLLGSLYEATDGVPSDQGAAAVGCLDLETGEWQRLASPQDKTTDTVLTFNDAYIVYWEMPLSDAEAPASGNASLCVYDRQAEEAYTLFEYPEEFLKSALVYGNHIVLVEDQLYFDTVVRGSDGTETMVYSADLPARSITPYKENAQHPLYDGEKLWTVTNQGDTCVLEAADGSEQLTLPDSAAEIAVGEEIFCKLNRSTTDGTGLSTWEWIDIRQQQPILTTQQATDDLRLEEGYLVWASYADSPAILFDTQNECFLRFDSLPEGQQYFRFADGVGFLQLRVDGEAQYYRLTEK